MKKVFNKSELAFIFICAIFLTFGFFNNSYQLVNQSKFENFAIYSESLVVGKLSHTKNEGYLANGGLLGWYRNDLNSNDHIPQQYEIYKKKLNTENINFRSYKSQTGGQIIFYSILDRLSPFSGKLNLILFKLINSILLATVIAFFLLWIKRKSGYFSAIITLVLIILSPWVTMLGNSLFFCIWIFFFPFVWILFMLERESNKSDYTLTYRYLVWSIYFLVLFKIIISGYEFITTTLIMFASPFIYYAVLERWKPRFIFNRLVSFSIGSLLAVLSSFTILTYQISILTGKYSDGLYHIIFSFVKRSHQFTNSFDFKESHTISLNSNLTDVLNNYWEGTAFDFSRSSEAHWKEFLLINFGELTIFSAIISVILVLMVKYFPSCVDKVNENISLVFTTWFSILAPLSWFIIFKGHSFIHTEMNFIVMYMPFLLFGFNLIANTMYNLFSCIVNSSPSFKR